MSNIEKAKSNLPALASTPALELDSSDVTLPRIRIGHKQSFNVEEGHVASGDLYATQGKDDENPQLLVKAETDPGLLIHVLAVRKGLSWQVDGELQSTFFGDPDAPADAKTTYDYTVVLPEGDPDVPYKFMLKSSSTNAARNINTVLLKNADRGPSYALAFRIKTAERSTSKGSKTFTYHVAVARQVEADPKHVELASNLAGMIAGSTIEQSAGNQPAI